MLFAQRQSDARRLGIITLDVAENEVRCELASASSKSCADRIFGAARHALVALEIDWPSIRGRAERDKRVIPNDCRILRAREYDVAIQDIVIAHETGVKRPQSANRSLPVGRNTEVRVDTVDAAVTRRVPYIFDHALRRIVAGPSVAIGTQRNGRQVAIRIDIQVGYATIKFACLDDAESVIAVVITQPDVGVAATVEAKTTTQTQITRYVPCEAEAWL